MRTGGDLVKRTKRLNSWRAGTRQCKSGSGAVAASAARERGAAAGRQTRGAGRRACPGVVLLRPGTGTRALSAGWQSLTAPRLSHRLTAARALQATRPRLEPLPEAAIRVLFADLLHALAACHEAGVVHLVRHSSFLSAAPPPDWLDATGREAGQPVVWARQAPQASRLWQCCMCGRCSPCAKAGKQVQRMLTPPRRCASNSRLCPHRWYRAPELLYGSASADVAADLWSAGCVLGELLGNSPLFPGVSDVDQLAQVSHVRWGM